MKISKKIYKIKAGNKNYRLTFFVSKIAIRQREKVLKSPALKLKNLPTY